MIRPAFINDLCHARNQLWIRHIFSQALWTFRISWFRRHKWVELPFNV